MKILPWIAMAVTAWVILVLAVIAAVMFRYQVVVVKDYDGREIVVSLDRWTGRDVSPAEAYVDPNPKPREPDWWEKYKAPPGG